MQRNLPVNDIILIHDASLIKGKYTLAIVAETKMSKDGLVHSCKVRYGLPKYTKDSKKYVNHQWISLSRSIQRLMLLLSVEEQDGKTYSIENNKVVMISTDITKSKNNDANAPKTNVKGSLIMYELNVNAKVFCPRKESKNLAVEEDQEDHQTDNVEINKNRKVKQACEEKVHEKKKSPAK